MKSIAIIAICMFLYVPSNAQNLGVINHYHSFWGNIWDEMGGVSLDVYNNGSTDVTLTAIRTANLLAPGHESYFCFGVRCYDSSVDTADQTIVVPAGQSIASTLIHYLKPLGNSGSSEVHYCIVNVNNPADSVCFRFNYHASVTGIAEQNGNGALQISPNPANSFIQISVNDVEQRGSVFEVRDISGRQVFKTEISDPGKALHIDVSAWAEGMYFAGVTGSRSYGKFLVGP